MDRDARRSEAESLRALVAEVVAEKLDQKIDQKIEARLTARDVSPARSALKAEVIERIGSRLSGALEMWARDEPGGRRRGGLSREAIASAAVRIADAEGLRALSMRRIAAELGAGTMTLYHYVKTKDELLALVTDTVMGEVVVPDDQPLPGDWREAITTVARRSREAFRRHPWTLDITDDPSFGPNSVRHFDQSLQALAGLGSDLATRVDVVFAVDEYVFGFAITERNNTVAGGATFGDDVIEHVNGLIATGNYPQLAALSDELGLAEVWHRVEATTRDEGRFERNLARFLDGIAADLDR